jgi:polyphosphate kinase
MKKQKSNDHYVERDVSWMYFNHRILEEAKKTSVPLLERISFLGIYSNNLDEFFRVRVASLSRFLEYVDGKRAERKKVKETLRAIQELNRRYAKEYEDVLNDVRQSLKAAGFWVLKEDELSDEQRRFVEEFYYDRLSGYILPVWFSALKELGSAADDCVHLVVEADGRFALIALPVKKFGRFIRLPSANGKICLMYLDDVVRLCLPLVFSGMGLKHFDAYSFKFTRDAEMDLDTDLSNGFLQKISKGLKSRKRGEPIRVLYDERMPKKALEKLLAKLSIDRTDSVLASGRYQNHKDLMEFPDCGASHLRYPPFPPIRKREFDGASILELVREKDRFLHLPYHSFDAYVRLLHEAAISPEVKSIRTTLYRLAKDSQVIQALMCAARNGKKVTVVIELLARFDEASNIDWSKKMGDAGIYVIFGVPGLKVHSKITHIASEKGDVAVISTGNFHEGNARCYTDFLMMTARQSIVREVAMVFEFVERPYRPVKFRELLVSPNEMRKKLLQLIDTEIRNACAGKDAYILGKVNHIVDPKMVRKLYEASSSGVSVNMLVRGNSSIVTGVPGQSENIRLVGIIDRFLEHARILIFANGGSERYFIGSADWMPRNFDRRIEVLAPVYDPDLQKELKRIVLFGLKDSSQGRIVDGSASEKSLPGRKFRSQEALYKAYKKENG